MRWQVGSLYKRPKFPIWVVGSESHYTVLLGTDASINDVDEWEELRGKAKIAFQTYDSAQSGMIPTDKIPLVLVCIDVPLTLQVCNHTTSSRSASAVLTLHLCLHL